MAAPQAPQAPLSVVKVGMAAAAAAANLEVQSQHKVPRVAEMEVLAAAAAAVQILLAVEGMDVRW